MRLKLITSAFTLLMIAHTASGQAEFDPQPYSKGSKLLDTFSGPNGWLGHIVEVKGVASTAKVIFWQDKSGIVTFGKLFDRTGRDLNKLAMERYKTDQVKIRINASLGVGVNGVKDVPLTVKDSEKKVYAALEKLDSTFYTGSDEVDSLYVFYDYNCAPCADTHRSLKKKTDKPMKWLPVQILYDSSLALGAGVLDGTVELSEIGKRNAENLGSPTPESVARVWHNTALLEALKMEAVVTPTILFKTKAGDIRVMTGHVDDEELREILASR